MKLKRSERLIDMTQLLLAHPHQLLSLTDFSQRYNSAKSSISEDLTIIKKTFESQGIGRIETISGAAGGVKFIPKANKEEALAFAEEVRVQIEDAKRLLPGGYVYLSDLLGNPSILRRLGKIIASGYQEGEVDVIMTVATKGVPIAQAVAEFLNVPFVIVRRDSKITEGSTVSINYVSGSSERVEKMELSKRSLKSGSKVLIVDDFLKGGGTVNGLRSLIAEFDSTTVGTVVFCESGVYNHQVEDCTSILYIEQIDTAKNIIKARVGSFIEECEFL